MSKIKTIIVTAVALGSAVLGKVLYDNHTYDSDGYNKKGYNKDGFSRSGYDKHGYNRQGYNSAGYDKYGYNSDGYDSNGYDKDGFNIDGYDEQGFDKYGYDHNGYDESGYNKQGYNRDLKNRDGKTKEDLLEKYCWYSRRVIDAKTDFKNENYTDVCMKCRKVVESILKNLLKHFGEYYDYERYTFVELIDFNSEKFGEEMAGKLHELRKYGNNALHEDEDEIEIKANECSFVIKVTEEIINLFLEKCIG